MANPSNWPVTPVEPLKWLNDRIEAGKPACYLRFNDGEAYSMFGMKSAPETNGEHVYSDRMRRSLLKTFVSACCESVEDESVLVGSWWYEDPGHEAALAIQELIDLCGFETSVRWGRGHIYHREEGDCPNEELLRFVKLLRKKNVTTIVGNESLEPIAKGMGGRFVKISTKNAEEAEPTRYKLEGTVVYCGGFPVKEWAWNKWKEDGWRIIDAGSLFDGLVGNVSREWLKPGLPHSDFYYGAFKKAVLG